MFAPSLPEPVVTIDCHYMAPARAAAYLLIEDGQAAFVENNTVHAVPRLLQALADHGLQPEQVAYIIITHLHFDHAGGTSALAARCPNAIVLAHPRAVRHLADPSRLIASVTCVYGQAEYDRLYSPITPIDPARIRGMEDGEAVRLGTRELRFLHTRGHANHHVSIHDLRVNGVFSGDCFGAEFRPWRQSRLPFLICSCAPTDFDPAEARASVRRILDTGARRIYVTHFGELKDPDGGAEALLHSIDAMEAITDEALARGLEGDALRAFCEEGIHEACRRQLEFCGAALSGQDLWSVNEHLRINAQGLAVFVERRRNPKPE